MDSPHLQNIPLSKTKEGQEIVKAFREELGKEFPSGSLVGVDYKEIEERVLKILWNVLRGSPWEKK